MPLATTTKAMDAKRNILIHVGALNSATDPQRAARHSMNATLAIDDRGVTKAVLVDVLRTMYSESWHHADPGAPNKLMKLKKAALHAMVLGNIKDIDIAVINIIAGRDPSSAHAIAEGVVRKAEAQAKPATIPARVVDGETGAKRKARLSTAAILTAIRDTRIAATDEKVDGYARIANMEISGPWATKDVLVAVLQHAQANGWGGKKFSTSTLLLNSKKVLQCLASGLVTMASDKAKADMPGARAVAPVAAPAPVAPTPKPAAAVEQPVSTLVASDNVTFDATMQNCTVQELIKFQAVVLNPVAHNVAPYVAKMTPRQQPLGLRRDLLDLCGITYDNSGHGPRDAGVVFNELWGNTFDQAELDAREPHQGCTINENVHLRTLRMWKLFQDKPEMAAVDPRKASASLIQSALKQAKIENLWRGQTALYMKLHWYATRCDSAEMTILWDRHYGIRSNTQPREAKVKKNTKKATQILMNTKKVERAIKKAAIVKASRLKEQIFEGFSKQNEVALGGVPIGTIGYNDNLKGRNRWQSLDPESNKRFTSRDAACNHCFDLACGNGDLWADKGGDGELLDLLSVDMDIKQDGSDSTRHYVACLHRDGMVTINAQLSVEGTDGLTSLLNCSLRWHRLLDQPVRVPLAEILIPLGDWAALCKAMHAELKVKIKEPLDPAMAHAEDEQEEAPTPIDIYADSPYDPKRVEFSRKLYTVDLLLKRIQEKELQLDPDFQRQAGLWSKRNSSRLIESILCGIPLPMFIFRAMDNGDWQTVDGLQRLTSILWFVVKGGRLTGLEYLVALKGRTFADMDRADQRKILEAQLSCVIIAAGTPIAVTYNVFSRLNAGGVKLNRQELRHALHQGIAANMIRDLARTPEFQAATKGGIVAKRMQDREVVLRFLSFTINDTSEYKGGMDQWLARTMEQINNLPKTKIAELEENFLFSMAVADRLLGEDAFRVHAVRNPERRSRVNKALFECWACAFGRLGEGQVDLLVDNAEDFATRALAMIETHLEYQDAVVAATSRTSAVVARHEIVSSYIKARLLEYGLEKKTRKGKAVAPKTKATKAPAKATKAPTKAKATKAPTKAKAKPAVPAESAGDVTQSTNNGVPEFTLAEINKATVRTVTRMVATKGGKCTVILPSNTRVGLHTAKKKGGVQFIVTDMLTDETFMCGSKTASLVERLQSMA